MRAMGNNAIEFFFIQLMITGIFNQFRVIARPCDGNRKIIVLLTELRNIGSAIYIINNLQLVFAGLNIQDIPDA